MPLVDALSGAALRLVLLSGASMTHPMPEIITPGRRITIQGLGLPKAGEASARGNLVLELDVVFPSKLSEVQRRLLQAAFFLPESKEDQPAVKDFVNAYEDPSSGWNAGG